jgi:small subunit ribosomal protein S17
MSKDKKGDDQKIIKKAKRQIKAIHEEKPSFGGGRQFVGKVVSDKMEKTVVVEVIRKHPHPLYKKVVAVRRRFYADNRLGAVRGDVVEIKETRPLSKLKRFRVISILGDQKNDPA